MPNNDLGKLRRSMVVMTHAPGAVVDFRADGVPVSAVVAGLEEWDRRFPPAGSPEYLREYQSHVWNANSTKRDSDSPGN